MNILFLIGNGFDLNVGLNTRFTDALELYLKEGNTDKRIIKFKEDIIEDKYKNFEKWSDFEKQMGIYTEKYNSKTVDDYCFCMENFKESLIKHIKKEENRIDFDAKKNEIVKVFYKSIYNFYDGLTNKSKKILQEMIQQTFNNRGSQSYRFITFNYTSVLDSCLEFMKRVPQPLSIRTILHIHGNVLDNPIMGIDNPKQIANKELLSNDKLIRKIVKPIINKELENLNDVEGIELIGRSDIICLFGLSLGETDTTWWKTVGDWLKNNTTKQLVIFNVINQHSKIHHEEIEHRRNIKEKFCLAAGLSELERKSILGRIHIGFNTDMFRVNLASPYMDVTKAMKMITEAK